MLTYARAIVPACQDLEVYGVRAEHGRAGLSGSDVYTSRRHAFANQE